jgi:hypothetical protein
MSQSLQHNAPEGRLGQVVLNRRSCHAPKFKKNQGVAVEATGQMMGQGRDVFAGGLGIRTAASGLEGRRQQIVLTPAKIVRKQLGGQPNPTANFKKDRQDFRFGYWFKAHPGFIDGKCAEVPVRFRATLDASCDLTRGPFRRENPLMLEDFTPSRKPGRVKTAFECSEKTPPERETSLNCRWSA